MPSKLRLDERKKKKQKMKLKIERKEDKPLVERYELQVKIEDVEATPSNEYVKQEISKSMNKPQEVIVVKRILQAFGKKEAEALVYVYNSADSLKKFEPKKKTKEGKEGEKKIELEAKEKKE